MLVHVQQRGRETFPLYLASCSWLLKGPQRGCVKDVLVTPWGRNLCTNWPLRVVPTWKKPDLANSPECKVLPFFEVPLAARLEGETRLDWVYWGGSCALWTVFTFTIFVCFKLNLLREGWCWMPCGWQGKKLCNGSSETPADRWEICLQDQKVRSILLASSNRSIKTFSCAFDFWKTGGQCRFLM